MTSASRSKVQGEARIQLRLLYLDPNLPLDGSAFRQKVERRVAHVDIQDRGDFPRDADHTEAARQVRRQFDIQHYISQHVRQRRPGNIALVMIHDDDAFVLIGDAQFLFRADHALVENAAQFLAF